MVIRIDALDPTALPSGSHELPAMKDGLTVKLTVAQINSVLKAILDPNNHSSDAFARGNHTGQDPISAVTGLQAALDAKDPLAVYAAKSSGFNVTTALNRSVQRCTAALTATFDAAATLGNNFEVTFVAEGGAVTLDPNGAETINGLTTLVIPMGSSAVIRCTGTNFFTVIKPAIWQPIGVYDFTGLGTSGQLVQDLGGYRDLRYRCDFSGSGSNGMAMQFSDNNGSSFVTSANYVRAEISYLQLPSSAVAGASASDTAILLGGAFPAVGNSLIARGELIKFNKAANKVLDGSWHSNNGATSGNMTFKMGYLLTMLNTFNALKFYATSGTVDGRFVLEGIRG